MKHGRLAHIRSQFSLFRRSPTHKNLPLATFCTSEQLLFGSFCRSKKNKPVSLSGAFHCMESMPLSGQHAMRAREFRGFANLDSVRRSAALPTVEPLGRSLSGTFSLLLKRQDKSTGRRGAAPYLYTRSVYKCATLRVHRSLASQAFCFAKQIKTGLFA